MGFRQCCTTLMRGWRKCSIVFKSSNNSSWKLWQAIKPLACLLQHNHLWRMRNQYQQQLPQLHLQKKDSYYDIIKKTTILKKHHCMSCLLSQGKFGSNTFALSCLTAKVQIDNAKDINGWSSAAMSFKFSNWLVDTGYICAYFVGSLTSGLDLHI